ncbi:Polynucleotidyl transferase ribonuclease H fold protein with HRDC domain [Euphorbia peplus]|nr:Polynucleotidyl transferase ribonuclease H fold protein with HRDC domain [Euphorbia peplus]
MEYKEQIRIAFAVVSLTTLSILFVRNYRRRQSRKIPLRSCYLHSDPKPQLSFTRVLADNSFSHFKHFKNLTNNEDSSSNSHPYEREITGLIENPSLEFGINFDDDDDKELKEMRDFYVWVETESSLTELADILSQLRVFAVDTEQHSLRSFLGFTALIQISTQNEDYLLDTIALHDAMGILRPVFADPSICKVFHGADNDVLWLQRDFHIYVVNLFDTAKACELLSKPQKSLAYLLETYCGVATNKLLQLEDWRQRPLSAEMLKYARIDAHYLLYIASCLIAELKQQDNDEKSSSVLEVCCRSNSTCLQLYTKDIEEFPGESAASSLFSRHLSDQPSSSVSCEIQDLVRRLCTWRDLMARVHDESLRFVLSDQAIVSLADNLPTNRAEIYDTVVQANMDGNLNINSSLSSTSLLYSHFDDLCCIIQDKKRNIDDIFSELLKKCLGPNGSCPWTVYNYALLVNCDLKLSNRSIMKKNGMKNCRQVARKASRELFVKKFSCKSPVYHNCKIFANDGRLLCYCDQRKLEWYIRRDLAKLIDEDPPSIMLLFEPKGRPEDEDNDFYIQSKKNICVSCGEGSHYLRYRIIPSCYRMHFPEHLKSHRSHDIVLLCVDCHETAHAAAEKYKKEVAVEFGIPLFVRKVVDSKEARVTPGPSSSELHAEEAGVAPLQLHTAAMALLRHGQVMPPQRREELMQTVSQYYGGREISQEDLEQALLVGMSPHGRRRFKKRRGLPSKHSTASVISNNKLVNGVAVAQLDGSQTTEADPTIINGDQDCFTGCSNLNGGSRRKDIFTGNVDDSCEIDPANGMVDLYNLTEEGSVQPKNNLKVSMLGHGPHGKQVVDHILKQNGDDGIREFCKRWRQVFVEATHPRFLPGGWDIMHSGIRAFGEFSVYNPANKASAA